MDLTKSKNIIVAIVVLLTLYVVYRMYNNSSNVADELNNVVLTIHSYTRKMMHKLPASVVNMINDRLDYTAGASLDLDNTGEEYIFVGGVAGEDDLLLVNRGGKMVNVIGQTNLNMKEATTYSAVSADLDHNGYTDLIVGRDNGVWIYYNQGKGKFIMKKLFHDPNKLPISMSITDYNKDGNADIYVSQYNNPSVSQSLDSNNKLLEGVGAGVFEDVTGRTQTDSTGNTTSSTWLDLNNDKLPDLVLTKDSGNIEIYQNTRGASGAKFTSQNKFVRMNVPTGFGYSFGIIAKDIDNDGNLDLLVTDDVVLRNHGNFKFTTETLKDDVNLAWNTLMENENVGGNAINSIRKDNKSLWINVKGPHRIFTNPSKNNNWIGVRLPNDVPYYNATVRVVSVNDQTGRIRKQSKQNTNSSGLGNDPAGVLTFDLGKDNRVLNLEVTTIYDGNRWVHPRPKMNMIATFRDMRSNNYTAKSRDEQGQLPLNKSAIIGMHQF